MLPNALQTSATDHVPVLADEVRELLAVRPGETVVDATFGAGGHASLLAADLQGSGKLIAIDRDPGARVYFDRLAKQRSGAQTRFLRGDFSVVLEQLAANGVEADAILLDLGVSSMQIDRPERGFSYTADAPLDMRMDPSADVTAAGIVNEAAERDLATIFKRYGEERYARQIAKAIVAAQEGAAVRADRRSRRDDQGRHSGTRPLRRGTSRQARVPGTAHRGQRRARLSRGRVAVGVRDAPSRWAARRDQLPLARGPDRQALHARSRTRVRLPARLPGVRVRQDAGASLDVAEGDSPERRRDRGRIPRSASGRLRVGVKV